MCNEGRPLSNEENMNGTNGTMGTEGTKDRENVKCKSSLGNVQ
jgi:hypothetical protein